MTKPLTKKEAFLLEVQKSKDKGEKVMLKVLAKRVGMAYSYARRLNVDLALDVHTEAAKTKRAVEAAIDKLASPAGVSCVDVWAEVPQLELTYKNILEANARHYYGLNTHVIRSYSLPRETFDIEDYDEDIVAKVIYWWLRAGRTEKFIRRTFAMHDAEMIQNFVEKAKYTLQKERQQ